MRALAGAMIMMAAAATPVVAQQESVTEWSYESSSVVSDLVPPGSELRSEESTGHVQLVSLTPLIRYQREEVMGTLGAFAAAGGGKRAQGSHDLLALIANQRGQGNQLHVAGRLLGPELGA